MKKCPHCRKLIDDNRQTCGAPECQQARHRKLSRERYRERHEIKRGQKRGKCVVCPNMIPESRSHNARTCSDKCSDEWHRIKSKARYVKRILKPKICAICKEEITDRHHHAGICNKQSCRDKKAEINRHKCADNVGKRPKPEKKKNNRCRFPGCTADKGANFYWCPTHHTAVTQAAGRHDGNYAFISSTKAVLQGRVSSHHGV